MNLREAASLWGTPSAHDRTQTPRDVDHGIQLANQARTWATPAARDWRSDSSEPHGNHSPPLSRQVHQTSQRGKHGSERAVLNPPFVEALMGFPHGWTDCAVSAMESFRSWRRTHTERLQNG